MLSSRIRSPHLIIALLLAALHTSYQSAGAQQTAANTLTVNTRLIYVDVVVRDDYGRFVSGLPKADFLVKEDGKAQPVVFFQESDRQLPPESSPAALQSPQPAEKGGQERAFSNVPASRVADPAATILLLDLLNTPASDQLYGIRQLIQFCRKLPPGHRVALFVLADRLHMLQGFTGSSDQLLAAANRLRPEDLQLAHNRSDSVQMVDFLTNFAKAIGPSPGGNTAHMIAGLENDSAQDLAQRFRLTAQAFQQIARATAGFPGRKNLVWLASNFPVGVGAQLEIDRSAQAIDLLDTSSLVGNLQIAIYPVSLAGLQTEGIPAEANGAGEVSLIGGPVGSTLNPQANQTFEQQFIARNTIYYAMNDLARDTGGVAFHGSNDIAGGVARALEDGSHYYTLAYRPTNTTSNGNYRQIRVTLPTSGYRLEYRRGYVAQPPADGTRHADAELAAALQPGTLDASLLRLRADISSTPGAPTMGLGVTLDARDLSFTTDAAGHRHSQLLVELAALPNTTGKAQEVALPQTQTVLNLDLSPDQYRDLLHTGLRFREQLPARLVNVPLRLGVIETTSHHLGTLELPAPPAHP